MGTVSEWVSERVRGIMDTQPEWVSEWSYSPAVTQSLTHREYISTFDILCIIVHRSGLKPWSPNCGYILFRHGYGAALRIQNEEMNEQWTVSEQWTVNSEWTEWWNEWWNDGTVQKMKNEKWRNEQWTVNSEWTEWRNDGMMEWWNDGMNDGMRRRHRPFCHRPFFHRPFCAAASFHITHCHMSCSHCHIFIFWPPTEFGMQCQCLQSMIELVDYECVASCFWSGKWNHTACYHRFYGF